METNEVEEMYGEEFFKFTYDDKRTGDKRNALNSRFYEIGKEFPSINGQIRNDKTRDIHFYEISGDHFKNVTEANKPTNAQIIAFTNFVGVNGSLIEGGKIYYDPEIYFSCWCWTTGIQIGEIKQNDKSK
eukprot:NODE_636_length_5742_cov_0.129364.p3 type:complete len:130 gc:universal NODE_636_length_5742_cov_0.129364:3074-2685(-)